MELLKKKKEKIIYLPEDFSGKDWKRGKKILKAQRRKAGIPYKGELEDERKRELKNGNNKE